MSSARLIRGDCLEAMAGIPDSSVDLVLTDPPYFRVKSEPWDRQWSDSGAFLDWLGSVAEGWARVMKPNASEKALQVPGIASALRAWPAKNEKGRKRNSPQNISNIRFSRNLP